MSDCADSSAALGERDRGDLEAALAVRRAEPVNSSHRDERGRDVCAQRTGPSAGVDPS